MPAATHGEKNDPKQYVEQSTGGTVELQAGILEGQLHAKKDMINHLVSKKDFDGAAAIQEEVSKLETIVEQLRAKITKKDVQRQVHNEVLDIPAAKEVSAAVLLEEKLSAKK